MPVLELRDAERTVGPSLRDPRSTEALRGWWKLKVQNVLEDRRDGWVSGQGTLYGRICSFSWKWYMNISFLLEKASKM